MTYNVFGGTLNLAQPCESSCLDICRILGNFYFSVVPGDSYLQLGKGKFFSEGGGRDGLNSAM